MLKKHVFSYIRKWCMVGGLCLAFPWVAYAQQQKISLNIQNVTLKQAMEQIKEQAVVNVAYSKEFVDPNKTVSLKVENVSLQAALTQLFKGTDVGSVSWIIVFFYTIKRNKTVRSCIERATNRIGQRYCRRSSDRRAYYRSVCCRRGIIERNQYRFGR